MQKDRTDMYAGGVQQQNMFCHLSANKKKIEVNTSYPRDMIVPEHHCILSIKPVYTTSKIGANITADKLESLKMVNALHLSSNRCGVTYLFPKNAKKGSTISGFLIYDTFREYKLDKHYNYQQLISSDERFRSYMNLIVSSTKNDFFHKFLSHVNVAKVNDLCQNIMYTLYNSLSKCSQAQHNGSVYEKEMLNLMQHNREELHE